MFAVRPFATDAFAEDGVVSVTLEVTGLEASVSLDNESVQAQAVITETGLGATALTGNVTVISDANLNVGSFLTTSTLGTVTYAVGYDVTGVSATTALGTTTQTISANVTQAGLEATAGISLSPGPTFNAQGNAQLSTAQAKFGSASLLLDGTDDFVTSNENVDLSSGDFTVDMWIRPASVTGYKGLWQSGTSSRLDVYLIGNQVQGVVGGSTTLFLSSTRISANVWTMISVEREGNVHRLYINGALEASSSTGNRPDAGVFSVGKNGFGDFNGYIDELRLSSVARYEGTSFTEPTEDYAVDSDTTALLHFDGANGSTDIVNETEGGVTVRLGQTIDVTGFEITGSVGTVSVVAEANVLPLGVAATGQVGSVRIWSDIVPTPGNSWSDITPSGGVWTEVAPAVASSWTNITPSSGSWDDVTPGVTPDWTDIAA